MALGVALSVKACLGVSPISCIPYVFSLRFPLSLGTTTILFNILLILLQVLLLRKQYQLFQLIQLPVVFVFGFFIDFTMHLISWLEPAHYLVQAFVCLLGCVVLAFGVFLEVKAKLTYLPGEGLAMAITKTFKVEFGKSKIGVDSSFVLFGLVSSFLFLHRLDGIREGTVAAALLVGYIVRFYDKWINLPEKWLATEPVHKEKELQPEPVSNVSGKVIVTISREYGSGGHEIGKKIAQLLGISFYDKELIQLTAEKGGFTPEYIHKHEQKLAHSLLFSLYEQNYAYINEQKPPLDALFMVQSKVIRDISEKDSCVIVGRCANFILKDNPACFNVFVHANKAFREQRIQKESPEISSVTKVLDKINHDRTNYCKHFTGKDRNDADNYNLTIDSSLLGVEKSAELIVDAINKRG